MPFPAEWQGYSPGPYATDNNLDFEMFDLEVQRHSHMGATPISEPPNISQDPTGLSMENPREMTIQSPVPTSNPTPVKGKRVRTGCLTCRERHLKCDEAVPDCMNCRKRGRECKRGVRLNFLEINLHRPAATPSPGGWEVEFQDESRDIASEYQGGLGRYAPYAPEIVDDSDDRQEVVNLVTATNIQDIDASADRLQPGSQHRFNYTQDNATAKPSENSRFKADTGIKLELNENEHGTLSDASHIATPSSSTKAVVTPRAEVFPEQLMAMRNRPLAQQTSTEEVENLVIPQMDTPPRIERPLVEQVFQDDHVQPSATQSNEPVGRNILTSAEEIHYMQVFVEEVAVWMDSFNREKHFTRSIPYHALRSTMLLNALLACGVKHTSLAAPENHDKALFYYNTATTQLLRSLQNPDRNTAECATTAIVLNVYEIMCEKPAQRMSHIAGSRALVRECGWDARSTGIGLACFWLNIGIEVLNCLATNWQTTWSPDEWGMSLGSRNNNQDDEDEDEQTWVHRALYIIAKVANFRATASRSDEISSQNEQTWTHPLESPASSERLRFLQLQHAYQVCGIVAHTTDKGVATVAIRCLAIAAAVLTNPNEQDEVLEILDRFNSTNGWRLGAVEMELKRKWGWERMKMPTSSPKTENSQDSVISAARRASMSLTPSRILTPPVMGPAGTKPPVNPLSFADFRLPNHPYQNWYEPPSRSSSFDPPTS
ncbi:Transcriptional regulatory protein moc3 [Fusarium oxysporum f. sp. cubense race 1]|uniref:Transcriptional regulatory protein moc3 n=1 Tax=Fusarium oxysporum f. sp. cubense (strain race 1) TaxID=1229664 RepID=N4UIX5_FUSC1|nr:Transcriptional regulatory protein moc3 [Fusarium oxysporum f. sp. cubense race 1]